MTGRLRFLVVVLVPAAVLMALEIVSSRLLAPVFGNSVYVWGSIIGVFLAAMSVGYVVGGRFADRRPELPALGQPLLLAALLVWLAAVAGRPGVTWIGEVTGGRPAGTLLAAALLFGPATLLLATVSPFAVRLAARDPARLGGVAGNLFALSTGGSLAGTFAATFLLLPALEVDAIFALLVSATAAAAAAAFGVGRAGVAAGLVAVVAWSTPSFRPPAMGVLVERATPYQTLVVTETAGERWLYSDGTLHGAIDLATGLSPLPYPRSAATLALFTGAPRRVLVVGAGTGGVGRLLLDRFASIEELVHVDVDPAVVEIARDQFGLVPGPRERVVVADGRRFLADDAGGWDWIYLDAYVGHSVPFHLATEELFTLALSKLAPGGVVGVNITGPLRNAFPRAILRTLRRVTGRVEIFSVPGAGNSLFVARGGGAIEPSRLAARAEALDVELGAGRRFRELAAARLAIDLDLSDALVLTDRFAPIDALLDLSRREASLPGAPAGGGD